MSEETTRSTIYFKQSVHKALRLKAADTHRTLSDLVNEAVTLTLLEDAEDIAAAKKRRKEPTISYEEMLKELKAHGKL